VINFISDAQFFFFPLEKEKEKEIKLTDYVRHSFGFNEKAKNEIHFSSLLLHVFLLYDDSG
jgi:hypothetical protein